MLLARDRAGAMVGDGHPALAHRHRVYDGSIGLHALCADHGLTLALDELAWVSRWITPKAEMARRFDTRFFVAVAPPAQSSRHDDHETIASLWVRPQEALARQAAGELVMLPPTVFSLRFLAASGSAAEAMREARAISTPPPVTPKVVTDELGRVVGVLLPGDRGYDDTD